MRISKGLCLSFSILCLSLGSRYAQACDNVFVQSANHTPATASVGLMLTSTPPDSVSLSLDAGGSVITQLPVAPGSAPQLTLSAQVTEGSLNGHCQTIVDNQNNNLTCEQVIDPKYILSIDLVKGQTCNGGGDDDDDIDSRHCDNGMHVGEYRKLGYNVCNMPGSHCVPPHYGKPGCHPLPAPASAWSMGKHTGHHDKMATGKHNWKGKGHHGEDNDDDDGSGQCTPTPDQLSCKFTLVPSF